MRAGATPAATAASSSAMRSSNASEFASLLVPNTASPQSCDSSHLQCAMKRSRSGLKSALNGVTTGESTPLIRVGMMVSLGNSGRRGHAQALHAVLGDEPGDQARRLDLLGKRPQIG